MSMQRTGKSSQKQSKRSKKYNTLPTRVSEKEFQHYFLPHLSRPKRGFISKIPLYKIFNYILYQLHTGCQWEHVAIRIDAITERKEISYTSIWKWFDRWSNDGSFEQAFIASVRRLNEKKKLRIKKINLDGTNSVAKKGAQP
jgi:transposase